MRKTKIDEQIDSIGIEFFKGKSKKELEEIKAALLLGYNPYDEDDCIEAINNQKCDIRDIKIFTEKIYNAIIENGKFKCLENPPYHVCLEAIKYDYININYIKEPTLDMIRLCVMEHPESIKQIETYIENSGKVYYDPETIIFLTKLYNDILKINGKYIGYIHRHLRTKEMYNIAVETTPSAIFYYDGDDEDLYLKAVKQDGLLLEVILTKNQTTKVCTEAVNQNPKAIQYVVDLSKLQF